MTEPSDAPPMPGTIEYAAAAKEAFSARFERMKAGMPGGEDLVTLIYACAYDNNEAYCFGCDGEPNDLINLMAITVIELADRTWEKVRQHERFLPDQDQTPYEKVVAGVTKDLLFTVRGMTHDKKANPPSPIITPSQP